MKIKEKIIELRERGFSYNKIASELGCSKGTIAYHCGEGQKEKQRSRLVQNRKRQHPLTRKVERFLYKDKKNCVEIKDRLRKLNTILYQKIKVFSGKHRKKGGYKRMEEFTVAQLIKKIGENPRCSLTGRKIKLMEGRSYHLDHVVPRSKGGDNSLDNCQIVCREANQAKGDLTMGEFIRLCQDVIKHNKKLRDYDSNVE